MGFWSRLLGGEPPDKDISDIILDDNSAGAGFMGLYPAVDIHHSVDTVTVKMKMPQILVDTINVSIANDMLTIKAVRLYSSSDLDKMTLGEQKKLRIMRRTLPLPFIVASHAEVTATYKDNTLLVVIPRVTGVHTMIQRISVNNE